MNCRQCSKEIPETQKFCSPGCTSRFYNPPSKKSQPCLHCGAPTKSKYCSSSCAAIHRQPKQPRHCKACGTLLCYGWTTKKYCDSCRVTANPNYRDWSTTTLAELFDNRPVNQAHARIRAKARDEYFRSNRPKQCQNCGYAKYIEVCHVKPVKEFERTTPITVVNDLGNLVALCRNCHWEFDHGHWALDSEPALAA